MKKPLFIIFVLLFTTSFGFAQAQTPQKKGERIEALKIEFVLKKLELNEEDAKSFSFMYKSYLQEVNLLLRQKKEAKEINKNNPQKLVDDDFYYDEKMLHLKKQYRRRFQQVLSPEQIKTLYITEREFREELIKHLKSK
jgi:hypothetical protein